MVGREMNANELADELDYCYGKEYPCPVSKEASTMLRQLQKERDLLFKAHSHEMKRADELQIKLDAAEQVIQSIANEQIELSHDKIKWQNGDHIKWCKDYLNKAK
jgi:small-conductance mechanosensitive channel